MLVFGMHQVEAQIKSLMKLERKHPQNQVFPFYFALYPYISRSFDKAKDK